MREPGMSRAGRKDMRAPAPRPSAARPAGSRRSERSPDDTRRGEPSPKEKPADPYFIEPDGSNREEARRLGYRFIDLLVDTASRAAERPPLDRVLASDEQAYSPPEEGRTADELWPELESFLQHSMNPANPGYLGHMDSLASAIGIFSDALVSALNNNMLAWEMSPAFTQLEQRLTAWACSLFGLDQGENRAAAGPVGHLVSGGTLANMTALWVARNARGAEDGQLARRGLSALDRAPVFLGSETAHFSFQKAANLLGLGRDACVRIPADAEGRVHVTAMAEAVRRARAEGKRPFCLIGVAGTTVTGSLDPLEEIADLAEREGLWFHVDAAYGGAIALSDKLRGRLRGCERADSITFNPQKWLFVPKTCASVLFRDSAEVERQLREPFVYGTSNRALDRGHGDRPQVNLGEWTLQGTRRVDALKLYLTLENFGRARLARIIERNCELARRFASAIESCPELELAHHPDLNIVCFRFRGLPHWPEWVEDDSPLDRLNARIQERIEQAGHLWLSLPRYRNRNLLRAVILHPRCDEALLDRLLEEVRAVGRELTGA
jgi:glutamate/tyrosine decarboxylase-like PLP-dependent enzyme